MKAKMSKIEYSEVINEGLNKVLNSNLSIDFSKLSHKDLLALATAILHKLESEEKRFSGLTEADLGRGLVGLGEWGLDILEKWNGPIARMVKERLIEKLKK